MRSLRFSLEISFSGKTTSSLIGISPSDMKMELNSASRWKKFVERPTQANENLNRENLRKNRRSILTS